MRLYKHNRVRLVKEVCYCWADDTGIPVDACWQQESEDVLYDLPEVVKEAHQRYTILHSMLESIRLEYPEYQTWSDQQLADKIYKLFEKIRVVHH